MGNPPIFYLNLRPPATAVPHTEGAAIRWTESAQYPPGSCFGEIKGLRCKALNRKTAWLQQICSSEIWELLRKRGKEGKHIFTPCLTGTTVPKTHSMTSSGEYLA